MLIIGLASVRYLFEMVRMGVGDGKAAWAGRGDFAVRRIYKPTDDRALPLLPLDRLASHAALRRPVLRVTGVWMSPDTGTVEGQAGHVPVRDRANKIVLDRRTGALLHNRTPRDYYGPVVEGEGRGEWSFL